VGSNTLKKFGQGTSVKGDPESELSSSASSRCDMVAGGKRGKDVDIWNLKQARYVEDKHHGPGWLLGMSMVSCAFKCGVLRL
jgi:hypothetical protein